MATESVATRKKEVSGSEVWGVSLKIKAIADLLISADDDDLQKNTVGGIGLILADYAQDLERISEGEAQEERQ